MSQSLDFENPKYQGNYAQCEPSELLDKTNIGKRFVYVTKRDIDNRRGYVFPRYGIIHSVYRNRVRFNEGWDDVNVRDIIECGLRKEENI